MKKLQHQNSCTAKTEDTNKKSRESGDLLVQTQLPEQPNDVYLRSLQGKILVLQERNKSVQNFYQQKIAQLKQVLAKQTETKQELMQQLTTLSLQNHQQNKYVTQLKSQIDGASTKEGRNILQQSQKLKAEGQGNGLRNEYRQNSRSRGKLLFSTRSLGMANGNTMLKKCKSSQFNECEYFNRQSDTKVTRNLNCFNNQRHRAG